MKREFRYYEAEVQVQGLCPMVHRNDVLKVSYSIINFISRILLIFPPSSRFSTVEWGD